MTFILGIIFLIGTIFNIVLVLLSGFDVIERVRKVNQSFQARNLKKVWRIKDGDLVIVVCSELSNPIQRQLVEPREFIYSLKYGDVDAYFEVIVTLLRLFPKIRLRTLSAGEADNVRLDMARHLVVIGGPDYNSLTDKILDWKEARNRFEYRSPYVETPSQKFPKEIVLFDKLKEREYCFQSTKQDYGYFENLTNPDNPESRIILIGGCHTIGVAGAIKAFSMPVSESGEIPKTVLLNSRVVAKKVGKSQNYSVLVKVKRVSQTINMPLIDKKDVSINDAVKNKRRSSNFSRWDLRPGFSSK